MSKRNKLILLFINVMVLGLAAFLFYYGNLPLSKQTATKRKSAESYYLHGCDNLSYITTFKNAFRASSQDKEKMAASAALAQADFSKTIEMMPDCGNAYWKRGAARTYRWLLYGDPQNNLAAIIDYQKAIELSPDSPEVRFNLWLAYLNAGKSDLAKEQFKKLEELDPNWRKDFDNRSKYGHPY